MLNKKLQDAKLKLQKAKTEYKEIVDQEKKRFGEIAEQLDLLELSETDIIVALSYFKKAPVEEQLKMHKVVQDEIPSRFQNKVRKAYDEAEKAQKAHSASVNPNRKDQEPAHHAQ